MILMQVTGEGGNGVNQGSTVLYRQDCKDE